MSGTMGNPLMAITDAVPGRILEARDERDRLIGRVLELNQEIARLETALQVTGLGRAIVEDSKPIPAIEPPEGGHRRRSRDTAPPVIET